MRPAFPDRLVFLEFVGKGAEGVQTLAGTNSNDALIRIFVSNKRIEKPSF